MPNEPLFDEPQITYAHVSDPDGVRFRQYASTPIPPWAVDVQPYLDPLQLFYNHIAASSPDQWRPEAPAQHLYLHAGARLCVQHQLHENPAFALNLQNSEAEDRAFLHSFDQAIAPYLSPYLIKLLIEHLQHVAASSTPS